MTNKIVIPETLVRHQSVSSLSPLATRLYVSLPSPKISPQVIQFQVVIPNIPLEPCQALRDSIVNFAKQYLGKPYRHRGKGPQAFDCSGFTSFVMQHFGYYLPPSSAAQAHFGTGIPVEQAYKGDLLFFGNKDRKGRWRVNHAALVISEEGEKLVMIHAARRGITIDEVDNVNWQSYYGRRLVGARRIIHEGVLPQEEEKLLDSRVAQHNLSPTEF
ncbi:MAG: C40 family peptidase [Cytophagales bacterium]|nr:C40 family peptidase [Bernardetiaceae bacterium]MDW8209474.1 C40 family peptidase [Cytophagales bacterium]